MDTTTCSRRPVADLAVATSAAVAGVDYGVSVRAAARPVRVISFGYGHDRTAPTADITIDLRRVMHDPASAQRVLHLDHGSVDGRDPRIQQIVYGTSGAVEAVDHAVRGVAVHLGEQECVIAFGCQAGVHRSVALAELAAGRLALLGHPVQIEHRDVDLPRLAARSGRVVPVYAGEEPPETYDASIFLCGPTPRSEHVSSWRPGAIAEITAQWQGEGVLVVFIPEPRDGRMRPDYAENRAWELYWGDRVDVLVFWIPRCAGLPGLTTNDEFGRWKDSGRVVLGTPPDAQNVRYQRDYATEVGIPVADTLAATIGLAIEHIGVGSARRGGQRHVPLLVWRTAAFRQWLDAQQDAGNVLRGGRLEWTHRVGPRRQTVFFWAFHAEIWIAAEQRVKSNEVVLSRPDVSAVVAYTRAESLDECEVVIVREFRTPGASADGFVRELPGGSGFHPSGAVDVETPAEQAVGELAQETGIRVEAGRVRVHQVRQPAATTSSHQLHVHAVELTGEEMEPVRADDTVHGIAPDTERTYVEVHTYRALRTLGLVDWATLGAITSVLLEAFTAAPIRAEAA